MIFMDIKDLDITNTTSASDLVRQFATTGFQATEIAHAAELIRRMHNEKAFVVLTFTANMV
jgi:deoxyhypusine synthase